MLSARHYLLMTTAAALCAAPMLAFGQAPTGGSSQMQGTTQTTPQQGPLGGTPAARGAATSGGATTGMAPNTGGAAATGQASQGHTTNPAGAATGEPLRTDGGRAAAPGAPPSVAPTAGAAAQGQGRTTDATGQATGQPGAAGGGQGQTGAAGATGQGAPAGGAAGGVGAGSGPGQGATSGQTTGTTRPATTTTTGTTTTTTGATTTGMAVDSARLQGGRRASRVIGSTVYNENNESIGSVDDLIVPQGGAGQPVAILSVGGFLGIGARLVAVPYEQLQYNAERDRWMLQGASRDTLQALPEHRYEDTGRRG